MKIYKKCLCPIVILIITIVLAIPATIYANQNATKLQMRRDSRMSPVIMIPGSSASINRFDTLVQKINERDHKNHSLLKVYVKENGQLVFTGRIRRQDNEPFIVVGFQNNHDGYSNIKKQAKWFNLAFNELKQRYNFNNFKAIGHSNGGLIYTAFLENYFNTTSNRLIRMKVLMTIGSPYNFAETSNRPTQMLKDFIKNRKNLPKYLTMYSVAGTKNYVADSIVPVSSVEAGKYIYQGVVKHYTQITVTGRLAQHSELPQNNQVLQLIEEYVLNDTDRVGRNNRR
ncbi:alpha/beta hydrolase [Lactobacillus acidophilus]|uniref:alpha/beta hydrolase n=1 Tax=Lactobacillus acidophilus TaxID=1579 RepID=UPI0008F85220|nr:alpha/beta hydrolase [Lactobacillus acidophilus]MCU4152734.1 alpha/beta hydrolase [Lactobacillus acidophilus]